MSGSPLATQMFDLFAPGTMLGRNELLAAIGEGGMARVILARQRGPMGFEKVVVVKVIHPDFAADRAAVGMLLDEARVAAQIDHPNVVQTYELGEANGSFYIVMEYLAGESLQRMLKAVSLGATFDPRMAARIVADAANGLHAAHELTDLQGKNLGLIHRDVSLGNIVVLYNGCVKVVDFGIAKTRDRVTSTTQQGQLKGKYAYMSPEQIKNEAMDRRSDVFSLGIVLWECLAARRLFHAENVPGILMQILEGPIAPPSQFNPAVPAALDAIAMKALERDPARRFQTALEMKRALEDVIWTSRCDAGDVQAYMTAVFGDRMRKRQALLANAVNTGSPGASLIEPRDARFDDTSGLRPMFQPPRRLSEERLPKKKKSWLGGMVLAAGVMIGVGVGIRLVGGKLGGRGESQAATLEGKSEPVQVAARAPIKKPAPPVEIEPMKVREEVAAPVDDTVPSLRSRLRPEHFEPLRVDQPETKRTERTERAERSERTEDRKADDRKTEDRKVESRADDRKAERTEIKKTEASKAEEPKVSVKDLYAKGSEAFLGGRFVEAVNAYKQVIAIEPGYAAAYRGLGLAYKSMGFDTLAIQSFKKYLALNPGASDEASIRRRIEQLGGTP